MPERAQIGDALLDEARPGDRIVIMGARDDTLSEFARELVERLAPGFLPCERSGDLDGHARHA